ncbi:adenylate/guanylate cyclase domain-containing protein [candidate division WOR-3 bacterium]|nr:adenylate/guanylate cyclase domain-containing protein [candidate division WOR-3 bacterium]
MPIILLTSFYTLNIIFAMSVLQKDKTVKITLGTFTSGIIFGIFTFLFLNIRWQSFLLGLIIGIQAYLYTFFISDFLMKRLRQDHILLSLLLNSIARVTIIFLSIFLSFEVLSSFRIGIVSFFNLIDSSYDKILIGLVFGLVLSLIIDAYELFDTLLGKNIFLKIIAGRFNQPFEEELFFMFLDLTSSTSLAEKLGHKKYLMLLNDFFHDLATPVSLTGGQIYKYVGDEAIITWSLKKGCIRSAPLRCFFMMREAITKKSKKYLYKYGTVPSFKAGLHVGNVVTGEIGLVKKEISHIGDAINTTSRLTELCKELGKPILTSRDVLEIMTMEKEYVFYPVDEKVLRGKTKSIEIFSVELRKQ